jgi:hypothetical protein
VELAVRRSWTEHTCPDTLSVRRACPSPSQCSSCLGGLTMHSPGTSWWAHSHLCADRHGSGAGCPPACHRFTRPEVHLVGSRQVPGSRHVTVTGVVAGIRARCLCSAPRILCQCLGQGINHELPCCLLAIKHVLVGPFRSKACPHPILLAVVCPPVADLPEGAVVLRCVSLRVLRHRLKVVHLRQLAAGPVGLSQAQLRNKQGGESCAMATRQGCLCMPWCDKRCCCSCAGRWWTGTKVLL